MLIDSHCHFHSLEHDEQSERALSRVEGYVFVDSGINLATSKNAAERAAAIPHIYASVGAHPFYAEELDLYGLALWERMIDDNNKIIAVGEVGLDCKTEVPLAKQKEVFTGFIKLAVKKGLPIVIHNRMENNENSLFEILDENIGSYERCLFHCFSQDRLILDKIVKKGGMVSFSLNILRNKRHLTEALMQCPVGSLLLETDSPYMRINGANSSPLDIDKVYFFAANLKGVSVEDLKNIVAENFKVFFNRETG